VILNISVECQEPDRCDRHLVEDHLIGRFLKYKPGLASLFHDGSLTIPLNFSVPGGLELNIRKGRPKRLVDLREQA
jgi:hypothetical protein